MSSKSHALQFITVASLEAAYKLSDQSEEQRRRTGTIEPYNSKSLLKSYIQSPLGRLIATFLEKLTSMLSSVLPSSWMPFLSSLIKSSTASNQLVLKFSASEPQILVLAHFRNHEVSKSLGELLRLLRVIVCWSGERNSGDSGAGVQGGLQDFLGVSCTGRHEYL